jgi:hypothetical protein
MTDLLQQVEDIGTDKENTTKQFDRTREQMRKKVDTAWEDTLDLVKRHPAKAIGIAVGSGFALGSLAIMLSTRRDKPASERLRGLADNGIDAWERVTTGFDEAISTLKCAVEDAVHKLK